MFRFLTALLALGAILAGPANAQDAPLRRLLSAEDARAWYGVGRVNMQGSGFCTGTLIAPDLVLTAAHCLYFHKTGKPIPPENVHFVAGYRKGWTAAHRKARQIAIHPEFEFGARGNASRVASDVALIELVAPIRGNGVAPFPVRGRPEPGDAVSVVSYGRERAEVPALQEPCHMIGRQNAVLVLSCDISLGSSGAPVFMERDGAIEVVSVVSALTDWNGRKVALGASVDTAVTNLMADLEAGETVLTRQRPGQSRLPQIGSTGGGRKTVTPPN